MAGFQFQLWRIFGSVSCLAVAIGILRFTYFEVDRYGGGFFPVLCVFVALVLIAAGIGILFRRTEEFIMGLIVRVVEFFYTGAFERR